MGPLEGSSPGGIAQARPPPSLGDEDALMVCRQIFQEFDLSDDELRRAAFGLEMTAAPEFERVIERAKKMPKAPWDSVDASRREYCVTWAMGYHSSGAERERMALRTGACLLLFGEPALGRKILQFAPDATFGVDARGASTWLVVARLGLMTLLIVLLAVQSALTGLYLFLLVGVVLVGVVVPVIWLLERDQWKLNREEREANLYAQALTRIDRGEPPQAVFAPDGTLQATH